VITALSATAAGAGSHLTVSGARTQGIAVAPKPPKPPGASAKPSRKGSVQGGTWMTGSVQLAADSTGEGAATAAAGTAAQAASDGSSPKLSPRSSMGGGPTAAAQRSTSSSINPLGNAIDVSSPQARGGSRAGSSGGKVCSPA